MVLLVIAISTSTQASETSQLNKLLYGDYWEPIKVNTTEEFTYVYYFLNHYFLTGSKLKESNELSILKNNCNELGRLYTLMDFIELNKQLAPDYVLKNQNSHLDYIKSLQYAVQDKCGAIYHKNS